MSKKSAFTALAKKISRGHQSMRGPQIIHPVREWFIGLVVAAVIVAVSGLWGSQTYVQYRSAVVSESTPVANNTVVYRESMVKDVLEQYSERDSKHQSIVDSLRITSAASDDEVVDDNSSAEEEGEVETASTTATSSDTSIVDEE